jgi:hypothetical protein
VETAVRWAHAEPNFFERNVMPYAELVFGEEVPAETYLDVTRQPDRLKVPAPSAEDGVG